MEKPGEEFKNRIALSVFVHLLSESGHLSKQLFLKPLISSNLKTGTIKERN